MLDNVNCEENETETASADDEPTFSESDCSAAIHYTTAVDCVGLPCEEGEDDTRSGSTFILTCVNGIWEAETSWDNGPDSGSLDGSSFPPNSGSNDPDFGEPCDVEGEIIDIDDGSLYENSFRYQKLDCYASHWVCSNGLWDIFNVCESYSSDDISNDSDGSVTWFGDGPPPWADENGCVDGYKWYCNENSGCLPCDFNSSDDETSLSIEDKQPDLNKYTTYEICYELCSRKIARDYSVELTNCIERCIGPLIFYNNEEGSALDINDSSETGSEGTEYITYSFTEMCTGSHCVGEPCDEDQWRTGREHSGSWVYSCVDGFWVEDYEFYSTDSIDDNLNDQTTTLPFVTTLTPIATTTSDFATTTLAPSACNEQRTYECPHNSFCVPADNIATFTCQCKSGYFMSGNMCHRKNHEADSCPTDFRKDLFKMNLEGLKNPKFYLNKGSVMIQVESQVVSRFRLGLIDEILGMKITYHVLT